MENIAQGWRNFIEGKDQGWIYDEGYEYFSNLSRGVCVALGEYLSKQFPGTPSTPTS